MNHSQPEGLLKRVEVAIVVQECMAVLKAERRDQTVDRAPDRVALRPQRSIMLRGRESERDPTGREHPELEQFPLNQLERRLILHALARMSSRAPSQTTLPRSRRMLACALT